MQNHATAVPMAGTVRLIVIAITTLCQIQIKKMQMPNLAPTLQHWI
jgi:hypothetical protein